MTVAANKAVVQEFITALEVGKHEQIAELLTADAVWWLPGRLPVSGRYEGRGAVLDGFLAQGLGLYQPGTLTFEIVNMIGEGDTVAVEWIADGTSAAGAHYRNHYHVAFDVADGRVSAVREYVDTLYASEVLFPDA